MPASVFRTCLAASFLSISSVTVADSVKVAFIGDQGIHDSAQSVLSLIANEGTDLVLIQGDLGYDEGNASAWENNLNSFLGENFPVLSLVGNHDRDEWGEYQWRIQDRINRVGIDCQGNTGVKSFCRFANLDIVQVAPGIRAGENINPDDDYVGYINSSLSDNNERWKICTWHKNQRNMQTGNKGNSTGWGVYEACLNAGALVATGHEHAYSRTHLLSSLENQTIVHTSGDMTLKPGQSFAIVSGLGGQEVRSQERGGDWWASIYTSNQGATFGALFCDFDADQADCYFKAIDGSVPDRFTLRRGYGSSGDSAGERNDETIDSGIDDSGVQSANDVSPVAVTSAESVQGNSNEVVNSEPAQPANARAERYSSTAAELFWDRAPSVYLRYDIYLDGQLIANTEGTSYFLPALEPSRQYDVEIQAINTSGGKSRSAYLAIRTFD